MTDADQTTRDALAEVLLTSRWPDGSSDGMPTRRVAAMLADALLASDAWRTHVTEPRGALDGAVRFYAQQHREAVRALAGVADRIDAHAYDELSAVLDDQPVDLSGDGYDDLDAEKAEQDQRGLGRTVTDLLAEHWPQSGVNGWYLADLLRGHAGLVATRPLASDSTHVEHPSFTKFAGRVVRRSGERAERAEAERDAALAQVAAVEAVRERWEADLDTGCPSCGPVDFCDHIEGFHHALSHVRAALSDPGAALAEHDRQVKAEAGSAALRKAAESARGGDLIWAIIHALDERGYTRQQCSFVENAARDEFVRHLLDLAERVGRGEA